MRKSLLLVLLGVFASVRAAQDPSFVAPMPIAMELSANFGELRANHFHSGLDLKTQQAIGQPVSSIDDGYVSRINISPSGYGNCLYVAHPNGYTSVYAHLDRFLPFIDSIAKKEQYRRESFAIDLFLEPDAIPVKRGQQFAYSGNTGSSGWPHLHFEIRDTRTQDPIDPQIFFPIADNMAPRPRRFRLLPLQSQGLVRGKASAQNFDVVLLQAGLYGLKSDTIEAWGKIGMAVKAYDHMPLQSNIYGIYRLQVYVDGNLHFEYLNDRFSFDQTRMINSLIDYPMWYQKGEVFMRTYLLPGNQLPLYPFVSGDGSLLIDEQRDYSVRMIFSDRAGNQSQLRFVVRGVRKPLKPQPERASQTCFVRQDTNRFENGEVFLQIPPKALYEDLQFDYARMADSLGLSDVHHLGQAYVPLQQYADLRIRLHADSVDTSKLYVARGGRKGGWESVGGRCSDGWIQTRVRELGTFKVLCDTVAPTIRLLNKGAQMRYKIGDTGTGIASYRGTVDGQWALFVYDAKNATLRYNFDAKRVQRGKMHTVALELTDGVGNRQTHSVEVWW